MEPRAGSVEGEALSIVDQKRMRAITHQLLAISLVAATWLLLADAAVGQIVSPLAPLPHQPGVPLYDLSTPYGRHRHHLWHARQYVRTVLQPLYQLHANNPAWVAAWQRIVWQMENDLVPHPLQAENGEWWGQDNGPNRDGIPEPVFVNQHYREGEYVRQHFRALRGWGQEPEY